MIPDTIIVASWIWIALVGIIGFWIALRPPKRGRE